MCKDVKQAAYMERKKHTASKGLQPWRSIGITTPVLLDPCIVSATAYKLRPTPFYA